MEGTVKVERVKDRTTISPQYVLSDVPGAEGCRLTDRDGVEWRLSFGDHGVLVTSDHQMAVQPVGASAVLLRALAVLTLVLLMVVPAMAQTMTFQNVTVGGNTYQIATSPYGSSITTMGGGGARDPQLFTVIDNQGRQVVIGPPVMGLNGPIMFYVYNPATGRQEFPTVAPAPIEIYRMLYPKLFPKPKKAKK